MSHQNFLNHLRGAARSSGTLTLEQINELHDQWYNPISRRVSSHCKLKGQSFKANDNISDALLELGLGAKDLLAEVQAAFHEVLQTMVIDVANDHNSVDTPRRYAKMVLLETQNGRYELAPKVTDFPNVSNADQLIVVKKLRVESLCSHHHQNIRGYAHIAILPRPDGKVFGLSKYSRILRWFAKRPQIQEELTVQVAEYIQNILDPLGVAVIIEAEHQCMSCRGVTEPDSKTRTAHLLGAFRESPELRDELYRSIA